MLITGLTTSLKNVGNSNKYMSASEISSSSTFVKLIMALQLISGAFK